MPYRSRAPRRPAMYNTPHIRNGGFGALQVEAITNRPLSIARRHLAASQLRMRDIEPDELSSSEWVRFLVMPETERDRWMAEFRRLRRNSDESGSSAENDRDIAHDKAEEARQDAEDSRREDAGSPTAGQSSSSMLPPLGSAPAVSIWARHFEDLDSIGAPLGAGTGSFSPRRPMHLRRAVTDGIMEAPPTYENAVRPRTPPPAHEPRGDREMSPMSGP